MGVCVSVSRRVCVCVWKTNWKLEISVNRCGNQSWLLLSKCRQRSNARAGQRPTIQGKGYDSDFDTSHDVILDSQRAIAIVGARARALARSGHLNHKEHRFVDLFWKVSKYVSIYECLENVFGVCASLLFFCFLFCLSSNPILKWSIRCQVLIRYQLNW